MDFWDIFAAVLGANLLTVMFVWGAIRYSRHEDQGTAGDRESHVSAIAFLLPMAFGALAMYLAFGGT